MSKTQTTREMKGQACVAAPCCAGVLGDARVANTTPVGAGALEEGVPRFWCRAGGVSDQKTSSGPAA